MPVVVDWRDLAVAGLCPSPQLLPSAVEENDRRDANAVLLRELLNVEQFGWSETQCLLRDQLVDCLCSS